MTAQRHGRKAGVPYDWRRPSLERLRAEVWDTSTGKVLKPKSYGVGWASTSARSCTTRGGSPSGSRGAGYTVRWETSASTRRRGTSSTRYIAEITRAPPTTIRTVRPSPPNRTAKKAANTGSMVMRMAARVGAK
jgi:hypothetical protein